MRGCAAGIRPSTLLGMYLMVGAGNFLLFFIGMELASVPMACLVAFDKYKRYSAEAGAKYILCALFASGLMLYGISFFYGTTGTLYFDDMAARITGSPLQIMAMVFFFAGLGFKISLVPFHLWTADTYQGAPTTVTSYLSVVSKGSAAFVLMTVLMKVFGPMIGQWQTLLYAVTVLSITVANLFAIRQKDLKRFLAFSSISQAGYIMLAVIGGSAFGMTSLVFYVLVYMAANLAVFGVVSTVEQHSGGKVGIEDYNGLYGHLALLLPAGGQGDVYHSERCARRAVPQRPLYPHQSRALHGGRPAAGSRQRRIRRHKRFRVRALTG